MGQGLFFKSTTPLPELRIVNQVGVVKFPKCAAWQDCLTAGSQVAMSTGRDPVGVYVYSSPSSLNSSFLKELFIYLTVVFVAAPGPSLDVVSGGYSLLQCVGFSLWWLLLLWIELWSAGSVLVARGLSCYTAWGIFPDQGSNWCPLHCKADS